MHVKDKTSTADTEYNPTTLLTNFFGWWVQSSVCFYGNEK